MRGCGTTASRIEEHEAAQAIAQAALESRSDVGLRAGELRLRIQQVACRHGRFAICLDDRRSGVCEEVTHITVVVLSNDVRPILI